MFKTIILPVITDKNLALPGKIKKKAQGRIIFHRGGFQPKAGSKTLCQRN